MKRDGRRSPGGWSPRAPAVQAARSARLPASRRGPGEGGLIPAGGGTRVTSGANGRLRAFAVTQIAASFVLLAGAGMLLTTLMTLQRTPTGFRNTSQVLALNVPVV